MKWLILVLGIAANVSTSVLVKMAMMPPRNFSSLGNPLGGISNWLLWPRIVLYGAAFLLHAAALARLSLNVAHPMMISVAVATAVLLSVMIFRERFHWTTEVGILFVITGMVLLTARFA